MTTPLPVLGLDVAKETYEADLLLNERHIGREFQNRAAGYAKLAAWLKQHQVEQVHACMEATGGYGHNLALFLHEHGHTVSIVNPAVIHHYALSQLARNKTDRLDAQVIARYCASERPRAWVPPTPEVLRLQQLVNYLERLKEERARQYNRQAAEPPLAEIQHALQEQVALLDRQIDQFQQAIRDHIDHHPDLRQRRDLLQSINGIGAETAAKLVAANLQAFDSARAAAAYAGLSPGIRESGTSVRRKTRLCKLGNANLRKAMYWPAITAIRCNPVVMHLADRLTHRHKCKMVCIGAAMHKLICLAYGVLKSGVPFDPDYALKAHPTA